MKIRTSSKNDEFFTPKYAIKPLLKYLKPNSRILCPFDQEDSNFVKLLKESRHIVFPHHINNHNWDFFQIRIMDYEFGAKGLKYSNKIYGAIVDVDYIISNPPFSIKTKVLEHLFKLDRPFAMLLPLTVLEGINRHKLFKKYEKDIQVIIFDKRISYTGKSPNFNSIYLCWKMNLPKDIIFEKLESECE